MSRALDLFLSAKPTPLLAHNDGDHQAWAVINDAASGWRDAGRHYSAAFAMERAIDAAWGDGDLVTTSIRTCIDDCARCVECAPLDSLEALAALEMWRRQLGYYESTTAIRQLSEQIQRELAERLVIVFGDAPDAVGYLIRGIELQGHLDGEWKAVVPDHVQVFGVRSWFGNGNLSLALPSAFALLRDLGDYDGMRTLIDRFPGEFESRRLAGWRFVVEGMLDPARCAQLFNQAASAFAEDQPPTDVAITARSPWSGENLYLWAKYFRARAVLARIPDTRDDVVLLVQEAARCLDGTDCGMVNGQVTRLRIIVGALAAIVGADDTSLIDKAIGELRVAQLLFGMDETDDASRSFLESAAATMAEFRENPTNAIGSGRLAETLDMLSRLPTIGASIAEALQLAARQHALAIVRGLDRTWVHRTLEAIDDERIFQRIFYRVAQNALPRLAQIRHGPLEYGKDVVVLADESGRNVLRMYQLKCGDIDTPGWRTVKPQLEEMFLVPLTSMNITYRVDDRIGVLVCNGHAQPNVDPIMVGWFEQERRDHGHRYEFMHLEDLANWIINGRLYGAFRAALREEGMAPT